MRCHRCRGLMVPEHFEDSRIDSGEPRFDGWRCINCGAVTDPVIAKAASALVGVVRPIRKAA